MKISRKYIELLQERLKNLNNSTQTKEIEELINAINTSLKSETTEDILELSKYKLEELEAYSDSHINDIAEYGNTKLAELLEANDGILSEINNEKQSKLEELSNLFESKQNELNNIIDDFDLMNDIPNSSHISTEISEKLDLYRFLQSGDLPFIFGILSRYDDYYSGFTTELGTWYSSNAGTMFNFLTGCHEYKTEYTGFYMEPKLCFLQGSKGNFNKKKSYAKYQFNTNMYKYPYAALGCLFIKNKTASSIVSSINFGGSSYTSTGGAGAFVGIPDYENEEITWTNVYAYTGSTSGFSNETSVTIPANSTIVVLLYTSSYYITTPSSTNYHGQFIHWKVSNVRDFLSEGLEIDFETTLKAWQSPGFLRGFELFK